MKIWCKSDSPSPPPPPPPRKFHWNISWNSRYEYANEWVHDVIASQFSMYFVHRNDENPKFQLWESEISLISTLNKCRMFALIYYMGTCFYMFKQQNFYFENFIYKIHGKLWGDEINSLIFIFIYRLYLKNGSQKKILDMNFVQNVCVFGTMLKQINCSFCCFLNHIICFCNQTLCYVLCGKAKSRLCHFIFIEEIVMKVSTTKKLICEDNERNYWNIFKYSGTSL